MKELEKELSELVKKIFASRREAPLEPVKDSAFQITDGSIKLSELFADKDTLILIHNMGKSCPYCTLWADGFNGAVRHLEDATSFVVASPDSPEVQKEFAESRDWKFRMVSYVDSSFPEEMGFHSSEGYQPGVSAFKKNDSGEIFRTGFNYFGPGDQFSPFWHFMSFIGIDQTNWKPKYKY